MGIYKKITMTRAQIAVDYLKAKMPPDTMENLGMNESYRMALEDMVEYMDLPEVNVRTSEEV